MSHKDQIPKPDHAAKNWMLWLANALVGDPEFYRISPEEAAEVLSVAQAFADAWARCAPRGSRCMSFTIEKNHARRVAESVIRPVVQRIKTDRRIPGSAKVFVGIHLNEKRSRVVPPPPGVPWLFVDADTSGWVTIRVKDSLIPGHRRPAATKGYQLYQRVRPWSEVEAEDARRHAAIEASAAGQADAPPIEDPAAIHLPDWRHVGLMTKHEIRIPIPHGNPGDEISYVAYWQGNQSRGSFGQITSIRRPFCAAPMLLGIRQRRSGMAA